MDNVLVTTADDGSRWVMEEDYEALAKRYGELYESRRAPPAAEGSLAEALERAHRAYETYGQRGDMRTARLSDGAMRAIIEAAIPTPPAAEGGLVEALEEQPFESYPALRAHIERMASSGTTGSLMDWCGFLETLNAALAAHARQGGGLSSADAPAQMVGRCVSIGWEENEEGQSFIAKVALDAPPPWPLSTAWGEEVAITLLAPAQAGGGVGL